MNKKFFISSGFVLSDYLWILPFIDGYNKVNNIKEIIFEDKFIISLLINKGDKNVINIIKKYKITYLKVNILNIEVFLITIKFIKKFFFKMIFLNVNSFKKILNKKYSWYDIQMYHAYWDIAHRNLKYYEFKVSILKRFKTIAKILIKIISSKLILKSGIKAALMSHTVYEERVTIANLRNAKAKVDILASAAFTVYRLKKNFDTGWHTPDLNILKLLRGKKIKRFANFYWNKRIDGKGNYEDARVAAISKPSISSSFYNYNVIFLHIFRDSPFNVIDRSRIFVDYFDWIYSTLKILKNSNENWLIKFHPNHQRWGENQEALLDLIIKNVFNYSLPKNIFFARNSLSNLEILKKAKKIVTFSGTVHLESACSKIKPITISSTTLSNLADNLIFKPKTKYEYQKLLLSNNYNMFKLNEKQSKLAKFYLYIRENVLKFDMDISARHIYANDSKVFKKINFNSINNKININIFYLNKLGSQFAKGLNNSVSKKFINYLN
jgi:hypothetical protein